MILGNSCQGGDCCVCDMNFDGRYVSFAFWTSFGCFRRVWNVFSHVGGRYSLEHDMTQAMSQGVSSAIFLSSEEHGFGHGMTQAVLKSAFLQNGA